MVMILPPAPPAERRYRTRTDAMRPFWLAFALYHHDRYDDELRAAEWSGLGLDQGTLNVLYRTGFSCYRLIPPCPDWLLLSIPELGKTRLSAIRRILPYSREIHRGPSCPGQRLENERLIVASKIPGQDEHLARAVQRQLLQEG